MRDLDGEKVMPSLMSKELALAEATAIGATSSG
jgi:hypothetical protein